MIQVYTGNGKGKTSASFGLAVRALGQNKKVRVIQFLKLDTSGEILFFKKNKNISIFCFGKKDFCKKNSLTKKDYSLAEQAFSKAKQLVKQNNFDMLVLDELNVAINYKLLDCKSVVSFLKRIPKKIEVVLTGRYASKALLDIADLVSEIKEVKHYYKKGVKARRGIEY